MTVVAGQKQAPASIGDLGLTTKFSPPPPPAHICDEHDARLVPGDKSGTVITHESVPWGDDRKLAPSASTSVSARHPGRMVEVGFLPQYERQDFALLAEGFPIWLLSLERSFVRTVTILGFSSAASYRSHLEATALTVQMVDRVIGHLGLSRVCYQEDLVPPVGSLLLVSGTPTFLLATGVQCPLQPTLFLGTEHWRSRTVPPGPIRWLRLKHRQFGGPSHFVTLFGCLNLACAPVETQIRRTIGHIFEFGSPPAPFPRTPSEAELRAHLGLEDVLHPTGLQRPVLHRTSFFCSGWGLCSLTPGEVGIAFGFPAWMRVGLTWFSLPCVPLQVMDGCLRGVLRTGLPPVYHPSVTALAAQPWPPPLLRTYLFEIGKYLPHSWIPEALITAKAAKSDDSKVTYSMWDQRILLIYPWAKPLLPFFRKGLMLVIRRRLWLELQLYLQTRHGSDWAERLSTIRQHAQPGRKRQRGGVRKGCLKRMKRDLRSRMLLSGGVTTERKINMRGRNGHLKTRRLLPSKERGPSRNAESSRRTLLLVTTFSASLPQLRGGNGRQVQR